MLCGGSGPESCLRGALVPLKNHLSYFENFCFIKPLKERSTSIFRKNWKNCWRNNYIHGRRLWVGKPCRWYDRISDGPKLKPLGSLCQVMSHEQVCSILRAWQMITAQVRILMMLLCGIYGPQTGVVSVVSWIISLKEHFLIGCVQLSKQRGNLKHLWLYGLPRFRSQDRIKADSCRPVTVKCIKHSALLRPQFQSQ